MMNEIENREKDLHELVRIWSSPRYAGITRPYSPRDVIRLRGSLKIEYTLAKIGAEKLWRMLNTEPYVPTLGALSGNQAVQMVQAGLKAIYLSGWQVAADANLAGQMYPDQSLYPANSVPHVVKRINQAFQRADQIQYAEGSGAIDWFAPIVADGEAGFGGPLNAFELTKSMIESGAAGVHYEDQLSSEKKCGHLGGKVLVPISQFIRTLVAARLAADVMGTPTLIIARTDANGAKLITSDIDPVDRPFVQGDRTPEGFHRIAGGIDLAVARAVASAPYADLIWCETSTPNIEEAAEFAEGVHKKYPGKMLAYNCSPSFHWKKKLGESEIRNFQKELGNMGYKFQFITLAGFHALNHSTFELAQGYAREGMPSFVRLQEREFESEQDGYAAIKHQHFVGTGYFDDVSLTISNGASSTTAMEGSTEKEQFHGEAQKQREMLEQRKRASK
jgi:isocitrate lyase